MWTPIWRAATPEQSEALRYNTISFLSDYGLADEFVGVVHSVILSIAPDVRIVDITHEVGRFDVRGGGLALARAAGYLNPGVVLAVVDPTVGTERRPIAVEVGGGASVLVGPDNGLLAPAVGLVGGADRAVELRNERYRLGGGACTFDGRDVFGPAAAHLAAGVPLEELGPEVDPAGLMPGIVANAAVGDDRVEAEVLWVDHYGNAQLNVDPEDLTKLGEPLTVQAGEARLAARRASTYAAIEVGKVGVVVDSYGLVSLAQNRRSCASALGLQPGSPVILRAGVEAGGTEDTAGSGRSGPGSPAAETPGTAETTPTTVAVELGRSTA